MSDSAKSRPPLWVLLLAPPAMLAGVGGGIALVLRRPDGLWAWGFAGLFLLAMGWILVSVLWPARADRTCPTCGSERLERVDKHSTVGIRCAACGFEDETQSTWLLAEEEGPLEGIVLDQRRARRRQRQARDLQPKSDRKRDDELSPR